MKVLNGQYWSSPHFTKEYIMYLELIGPKKLIQRFPNDNRLTISDKKVSLPKDAPSWFQPPKDYEIWLGKQGSLYFINPTTGHAFFYEVQL